MGGDYHIGGDVWEALVLNEELRRRAPEYWDSTEVIKKWRRKR